MIDDYPGWLHYLGVKAVHFHEVKGEWFFDWWGPTFNKLMILFIILALKENQAWERFSLSRGFSLHATGKKKLRFLLIIRFISMYNPTRNTFTKDDLFPKFYNQSVFETLPTNFFNETFFLDQFFLYQDPQKTGKSIDRHNLKTSHSVYKILYHGWPFSSKYKSLSLCRSVTNAGPRQTSI